MPLDFEVDLIKARIRAKRFRDRLCRDNIAANIPEEDMEWIESFSDEQAKALYDEYVKYLSTRCSLRNTLDGRRLWERT